MSILYRPQNPPEGFNGGEIFDTATRASIDGTRLANQIKVLRLIEPYDAKTASLHFREQIKADAIRSACLDLLATMFPFKDGSENVGSHRSRWLAEVQPFVDSACFTAFVTDIDSLPDPEEAPATDNADSATTETEPVPPEAGLIVDEPTDPDGNQNDQAIEPDPTSAATPADTGTAPVTANTDPAPGPGDFRVTPAAFAGARPPFGHPIPGLPVA